MEVFPYAEKLFCTLYNSDVGIEMAAFIKKKAKRQQQTGLLKEQ